MAGQTDMKSILETRPALKQALSSVAEVAGYLWQKGWAERNGGNLTLNITDMVDDEMRAMPAISAVLPIGITLPALKGCWFYCKGTGKRMRDLARDPMAAGSIVRILDDCEATNLRLGQVTSDSAIATMSTAMKRPAKTRIRSGVRSGESKVETVVIATERATFAFAR